MNNLAKNEIQGISSLSKNILIIFITLGIALIVLALAPIWPSFEVVKQQMLQNYIGKHTDLTFNQLEEAVNAPNSPVLSSLRRYDTSLLLRNAVIGICILLLILDVVFNLMNKRIIPYFVWFFLGFLFVIFSLQYLFMSWTLFATPGPILSLISAFLFVALGLGRTSPKMQ